MTALRRLFVARQGPELAELSRSERHRPVFGLIDSVPPKSFEPIRREIGVTHRVRNVFVAEIMLQGSGVVALIGELVAAGVTQHARMHRKWQSCSQAKRDAPRVVTRWDAGPELHSVRIPRLRTQPVTAQIQHVALEPIAID